MPVPHWIENFKFVEVTLGRLNHYAMRQLIGLITCQFLLFTGCSLLTTQEQTQAESDQSQKQNASATQAVEHPYQPTPNKHMDLLHTKLDLRPEWKEQNLQGNATLTFTPYFYEQDSLIIDAQNFDLNAVKLVKKGNKQNLRYQYNGKKIRIKLPQTFTREDTFKVFIDYTATFKPNNGVDSSVAGNRGLYFINPKGKYDEKPRQIWTQGETEYSSFWFPTLDRPNEKTTQEIYITVDTQFKTLSNGRKVYSMLNEGGTRTDYWQQAQPHAPYLFMLAVGDFAVVKDSWRDSIPVNYYVEPKYEKHARMIFGKTPEMMTLFSNLLGYDYPWAKYSQVAVRDFIAGAMENTSATIHFAGIQQDARAHIDKHYETLIAHELIHHWFGNLVTCESWSQLALNESFATYGEYLWEEHEYGKTAASIEWQSNVKDYLRESRQKQVPLIQYRYREAKNLFDDHRYEKGSCILHMLRNYLGDKAFFKGIQQYLKNRAYKPAEHSHLRLAMESASGKDLKWFFDQWFLSPGHPKLNIRSHYDTAEQEIIYSVSQEQSAEKYPNYRLPVAIDVYTKQSSTRQHLWIEEKHDTFFIPSKKAPALINFDAENNLLAEKDYQKPVREWLYQFNNVPDYLGKFEAIKGVANKLDSLSAKKQRNWFNDLLQNQFWKIRKKGLALLQQKTNDRLKKGFRDRLMNMARNDEESSVRAEAYSILSNDFEVNEDLVKVFQDGLRDTSYKVVKKALNGLVEIDRLKGLKAAESLEKTKSDELVKTVAKVYTAHGSKDKNQYLRHVLLKKPDWPHRLNIVDNYLFYLNRHGDHFIRKNLNVPRQMEYWVSAKADKKKLIQPLKELRDIKKAERNKIKKAMEKTEEGSNDIEKERKHKEKANLVNAINQLIDDLQQ